MSLWICDKETASCLITQWKQIQRQYVVSSQNLYSLLCIIHSCAHKMSDYIRIFLPLEKTMHSFIRVERMQGLFLDPGSLLGVSWKSPGSLLVVSRESTGNNLRVYFGVTVSILGVSMESTVNILGCYCESPGYLLGVPWVFP